MTPRIPVKRVLKTPGFKPLKKRSRMVAALRVSYGRHYNPDTIMPGEWELLADGALEFNADYEWRLRLRTMREMLACWIYWQVKEKLGPVEAGSEILRVLDQAEREGPFKPGEKKPDTTDAGHRLQQIIEILREAGQ